MIQELCLELVIRQEELGHPEQKVGDSSPLFVIFSFLIIDVAYLIDIKRMEQMNNLSYDYVKLPVIG